MAEALTPTQTRQQHPEFGARCSFTALRSHLPLVWPAPPDLPPSPKRRYRSHYAYLGAEDLDTPRVWEELTDFEVLLRLVDFSPLRPVLAQLLGWTSAKGWTPFDPVSLFLLCGWQLTEQWNRAATLENLAKARYAEVRQRLGFQEGVYPTEGGAPLLPHRVGTARTGHRCLDHLARLRRLARRRAADAATQSLAPPGCHAAAPARLYQ